MKDHRAADLHLSSREVAEGEQCIIRQKQLVAELAENGRPTAKAAALLETMERSLRQIRRLVR